MCTFGFKEAPFVICRAVCLSNYFLKNEKAMCDLEMYRLQKNMACFQKYIFSVLHCSVIVH